MGYVLMIVAATAQLVVPDQAAAVIALAVLATALVFELAGRGDSWPQARRIVPQSVIARANSGGPLQFGFEMGTGLRTYLPSATPHAAATVAVVLLHPLGGLVAGTCFGLGRSFALLLRNHKESPRDWDRALIRHRRLHTVPSLAAVALAVTAALF